MKILLLLIIIHLRLTKKQTIQIHRDNTKYNTYIHAIHKNGYKKQIRKTNATCGSGLTKAISIAVAQEACQPTHSSIDN